MLWHIYEWVIHPYVNEWWCLVSCVWVCMIDTPICEWVIHAYRNERWWLGTAVDVHSHWLRVWMSDTPIFIGNIVNICLGVSVNLVYKFKGKPGTTTVKHDFNHLRLKFHRGSPWVSVLSWLNLKANKDYFSCESVYEWWCILSCHPHIYIWVMIYHLHISCTYIIYVNDRVMKYHVMCTIESCTSMNKLIWIVGLTDQ